MHTPGTPFESSPLQAPWRSIAPLFGSLQLRGKPKKKVGLALSCGAARGLAHVGVIQVLEENGIEVDLISGSSMGAYVGALFAAGYSGRELAEVAAKIHHRRHLIAMLDFCWPRQGFIRGNKIHDFLDAHLGANRRFEDLTKPFFVTATNLDTLERHIFSEGSIADAVHASIAIPGIIKPVTLDGVTYIDGGVVDTIPASILRRKGADVIIASSVFPRPGQLGCKFGSCLCTDPVEHHGLLRRFARFINRNLNPFARCNLMDIFMRSVAAAQVRITQSAVRQIDFLIEPLTDARAWHDYHNHRAYIECGRRAAEEKIGEILASLDFPKPTRPSTLVTS